jgi:ubiquinone biosynthesis protein
MRLFRVAQRFNVEIQPQMILLHKTLFNIEGLGRQLYPQLDLWKTAHPVLKRWMNEQVGPRAILDDFRENLPQLRQSLQDLPAVLKQIADQSSSQDPSIGKQVAEFQKLRADMREHQRQRYWLTAAATGVISGTLLLALEGNLYWPAVLYAIAAVASFAARPRRD